MTQNEFEAKISPQQRAWLLFRLPVIRHIRWLWLMFRVNGWYESWAMMGYFENSDYDRMCLEAIRRGKL